MARARHGSYGGAASPADAIHRAATPPPGAPPSPAIVVSAEGGGAGGLLAIVEGGAWLRIAPFVVHRFGLRYRSAGEIRIALADLQQDVYRIVAVHDFGSEDCNPDLDEAVAAVFLARRVAARWQEPEDHPVECRAVAVLGRLDVAGRSVERPA